MDISWDREKAESNQRKHGVLFEEAATVLSDPIAETFLDGAATEERFITVGFAANGQLLLVVWCQQSEQSIRIISARRATKRERVDYEKGIRSKET